MSSFDFFPVLTSDSDSETSPEYTQTPNNGITKDIKYKSAQNHPRNLYDTITNNWKGSVEVSWTFKNIFLNLGATLCQMRSSLNVSSNSLTGFS